MFVRDLLNKKSRDTATVGSADTLGHAAKILARHHIGALPVLSDAGSLEGILSERDIVRALAQNELALADSVARYMTKDVITCTPDFPVADVMAIMTKGRFRHLPVLEHTRLIGIISIGDVVKAHIDEMTEANHHMMSYIASA